MEKPKPHRKGIDTLWGRLTGKPVDYIKVGKNGDVAHVIPGEVCHIEDTTLEEKEERDVELESE